MKQIMTMLAIILLNMNNVDAQCVESPIFTIDKNIPSYFDLTERHIARNAKYDNSNVLNELLRLNDNTTIELVDTLTDIKGGIHESYKEYYKGIEVEGTRFTIHYDRSGNAVTANGNFRTIENLDAEPIVSEEDALSNVIQYIGAEKYAWQENIVSYIKQDEYVVRAIIGGNVLVGKISVP